MTRQAAQLEADFAMLRGTILGLAAQIGAVEEFDAMIERLGRVDTIMPVIDPTWYRARNETMRRMHEIAMKAKTLLDAVHAEIRKDVAALEGAAS